MSICSLLQQAEKFEIQVFKKPRELTNLKAGHVSFSGAPLKHPYDPEKIILVVEPFSGNSFYYEFKAIDIAFVEELPNVVSPEGDTLMMARIWIKKRCIGVRCTPFVVEDITNAS